MIIREKDKKIKELQSINSNRWMEKQDTETIFANCIKQLIHDQKVSAMKSPRSNSSRSHVSTSLALSDGMKDH